jgi:hypothetical protein
MDAAQSEPLVWSVHIGRDQGSRRIVVVVMAVMISVIALFFVRSVLMAIMGPIMFLGALGELFLPIHYKVDDQGASSQCGLSVTRIEWSAVKRMWTDDAGVKLSPLESPSRLDAFRGVYLRFASNRDDVLAKIRTLWSNDAELLAGGDNGRASGSTHPEARHQDH